MSKYPVLCSKRTKRAGREKPLAAKKPVRDQNIVLDYASLSNTRYERCKLIYKGGGPPKLVSNDFIACEWIFENEAQNTLLFLKDLARSGGRELVLSTLGIGADC
jgi:hypothetical protein